MARLLLDVGSEAEIQPGDVVGVILGVTKIARERIGAVRVGERETYADVAEEKADYVLKKLNGIRFKGRKLGVRRAG